MRVTGEGDARLAAVVELAQAMAAAHGPRGAMRAAAERARVALRGGSAAISVWERDRGRLRVLVNVGELAAGEEECPDDESYPVHDFPEITVSPGERWWTDGERGAWVETAEGFDELSAESPAGRRTDPLAGAAVRARRSAELRRRGRGCCVVAPIVLRGRAWGALHVARGRTAAAFGPADMDFAAVLASVTAAGIAQSERLAEARRLAFSDPLTGLANRRAVDSRLDEALERHRSHGSVVSLVVCDINGLKQVNDSLGHATGDHLLERFGSVLSVCGAMLPGALAGRLGGDEFALLSVGPSADEVVRVADELCRRAGELEFGRGVACGVASTGDPIGPVSGARRLFHLADAAQYRAKAARSDKPVVAGRHGGPDDPVVRLVNAPLERTGDRRRFRGLRRARDSPSEER